MTERAEDRPKDLDPVIRSIKETGSWTKQGFISSETWRGTIPEGRFGITMAELKRDEETPVQSFAGSLVGRALLTLAKLQL